MSEAKYLIESEGAIYTVVEGSLQIVEGTEITSQMFVDSGFVEIPDPSLFLNLIDPTILYWQESEGELPNFKAVLKAAPFPQTIITSEIDLSHSSITGVEFITVSCEGSPLFACSFDGGTTWKMHNGSVWVTLTETDTGMSAEAFSAITATQWAETVSGLDSFMIRFTLSTLEDKVTNIVVDYTN